jgi:hypothetical protein
LSDITSANSAIAAVRAVPVSGGPSRAGEVSGLPPREPEPVERQADREVDQREEHQRLAPAHGFVQVVSDDPEHGRGEGAEEREVRDRAPSAGRHHLHERGERGVVEHEPHPHAEERPDRQVLALGLHQGQHVQADRDEDRADRHDPARAVAVDGAAGPAGHRAHGEQCDRETEVDEAPAPAGLRTDRAGEDAEAVVARAPGGDLREPERADGEGQRVGGAGASSLHGAGAIVAQRARVADVFSGARITP